MKIARLILAALMYVSLGATSSFGAIFATLETDPNPGALSAEAVFAQAGTTLTVTLRNTGTADATEPINILTALFFNLVGDPTLTKVSAKTEIGADSYYKNGGANFIDTAGNLDIGGQWSFRGPGPTPFASSDPSFDTQADYGISAAGFEIFGGGDLFGTNTPFVGNQGTAPDGLAYGIAPTGDNAATGNGGFNDRLFVRNAVVFTFNLPTGVTLTANQIDHVYFQYGTGLNERRLVPGDDEEVPVPEVPEPVSLAIWGLGLGIAGVVGMRKRMLQRA